MDDKKAIQMKLNLDQYELVTKASEYSGTSRASFVRACALKESRNILKQNGGSA